MAVTAATQKCLAEGVIVNAATIGAADVMCQNVSGEDMTISNIHGYNQDTSAVEIYIARVPDSAATLGTPDINDIFFYRSVAAKGSFFLGPEDIRMQLNDTNDSIVAYAGTADKVHIWIYGVVQPDQ